MLWIKLNSKLNSQNMGINNDVLLINVIYLK